MADISHALTALSDHYTELGHLLREKTRNPGGERVHTSRPEPLSPSDLEVDRFMVTMHDVLLSWEERVRAAAGLQPSTTDISWERRPAVISRACGLLSRFVLGLISLEEEPMRRALTLQDPGNLPEDVLGVVRPDYVDPYPELAGADAGREVLWLHRRAQTMTDQTIRTLTLDGVPCPHCELMMLTRRSGDNGVWCAACRTMTPMEEYTAWASELTASARH
ncbi:hypothetical protein [Nocardiopsis sp. MG754419]|uniref:hypothetical protein n=1 Tax=Nocardiopsis sp. MG754419 TaxID=2259865 RepID=UPI001BAC845F|nr:hypothetical protein [Nocardiopsis sp. MG754419]MBR8743739.1 hypothetical protein [Nocardiopsis sp. MG754419]